MLLDAVLIMGKNGKEKLMKKKNQEIPNAKIVKVAYSFVKEKKYKL